MSTAKANKGISNGPFTLVRRKEYTFRVKDGAHHHKETNGADIVLRMGEEFKTFIEEDKMPSRVGKFDRVNTETVQILQHNGQDVKIFRDEDDELLDEVKACIKSGKDPLSLINPTKEEDIMMEDDVDSEEGESNVGSSNDKKAESDESTDEEESGGDGEDDDEEDEDEEEKEEVKKKTPPAKIKIKKKK